MPAAVVRTELGSTDIIELQEFIAAREHALGYRPVSDEAWAELRHGTTGDMATVIVRSGSGAVVASAHASSASPVTTTGGSAWNVETVTEELDPATMARLTTQLLASTISTVLSRGGIELTWTVLGPTPVHDAVASTFALDRVRQIHQMRRSLPTGLVFEISTRSFDPSHDLAAWVRVNNRAFAWNPEQGHWTESNVLARMDEPWFDPDGFLIHERDGELAGFCWTKIHAGSDPALGEIYIIAVDPAHHGLGLGRALTLAGLDSLARRGITVGMLFVDADNVAAVRLYDALGFVVHRTDCLYHVRLSETTPNP